LITERDQGFSRLFDTDENDISDDHRKNGEETQPKDPREINETRDAFLRLRRCFGDGRLSSSSASTRHSTSPCILARSRQSPPRNPHEPASTGPETARSRSPTHKLCTRAQSIHLRTFWRCR